MILAVSILPPPPPLPMITLTLHQTKSGNPRKVVVKRLLPACLSVCPSYLPSHNTHALLPYALTTLLATYIPIFSSPFPLPWTPSHNTPSCSTPPTLTTPLSLLLRDGKASKGKGLIPTTNHNSLHPPTIPSLLLLLRHGLQGLQGQGTEDAGAGRRRGGF